MAPSKPKKRKSSPKPRKPTRQRSRRASVFSIATSYFGPTALGSDLSLDRLPSPPGTQQTHISSNDDPLNKHVHPSSIVSTPFNASPAIKHSTSGTGTPKLPELELGDTDSLGLPGAPANSLAGTSDVMTPVESTPAAGTGEGSRTVEGDEEGGGGRSFDRLGSGRSRGTSILSSTTSAVEEEDTSSDEEEYSDSDRDSGSEEEDYDSDQDDEDDDEDEDEDGTAKSQSRSRRSSFSSIFPLFGYATPAREAGRNVAGVRRKTSVASFLERLKEFPGRIKDRTSNYNLKGRKVGDYKGPPLYDIPDPEDRNDGSSDDVSANATGNPSPTDTSFTDAAASPTSKWSRITSNLKLSKEDHQDDKLDKRKESSTSKPSSNSSSSPPLRSTCKITAADIEPPLHPPKKPRHLREAERRQRRIDRETSRETKRRLRAYRREQRERLKYDPELKDVREELKAIKRGKKRKKRKTSTATGADSSKAQGTKKGNGKLQKKKSAGDVSKKNKQAKTKKRKPPTTERLLKVMDNAKEKFWDWIDRRDEKKRRKARKAYGEMVEVRRNSYFEPLEESEMEVVSGGERRMSVETVRVRRRSSGQFRLGRRRSTVDGRVLRAEEVVFVEDDEDDEDDQEGRGGVAV